MGRGCSGVGYKRFSHVRIVIEKVNFPEMIKKQYTFSQKRKWAIREALVNKLKSRGGDNLQVSHVSN